MKARWLLGLLLAGLGLRAETAMRSSPLRLDVPFMAGLTQFIEWPGAAGHHQRLIVGIVGYAEPPQIPPDPIQSRRLEFRPVSLISQMRECHVVLFGRVAPIQVDAFLQALRTEPVLTVAAIPGFARMGGMVEFTGLAQGRKFLLNLVAARRSGFRIHPGLMSVADFLPQE